MIIAPLHAEQTDHIIIEEGIRNLKFGIGHLSIESFPNSQFPIPDSPLIALLDADEIRYPLMLRKWKQGDYFYPLGMKKKKKLARFFIDQKLSKTEKEKIWVIEMDKKILWVLGQRIDDRFKMTDKTKSVLQLAIR